MCDYKQEHDQGKPMQTKTGGSLCITTAQKRQEQDPGSLEKKNRPDGQIWKPIYNHSPVKA